MCVCMLLDPRKEEEVQHSFLTAAGGSCAVCYRCDTLCIEAYAGLNV